MTPTSSPDCWPLPPTQNRGSSGHWGARLVPALACTLLGLSWQLLTVHYNYGGNVTALFGTGVNLHIPPALEREHIYRFPNSEGYDGQAYHFIAHDPLARHGLLPSTPDTSLRYRRILLPALVYLAALGQQDAIDVSYLAVNLAFLFLGAWWLAQVLAGLGIPPAFAVLYLLVPATVISLDRLTVDLAATSLAVAFVLFVDSGARWKLYVVLVLAALCRETGLALTAVCCFPCLVKRQFKGCLFWGSSAIPAVAWNGFVRWKLGPGPAIPPGALMPLRGLWQALFDPAPYPFSATTTAGVHLFDALQTLGLILAFWLAIRHARRAVADPVYGACLLWALTGVLLPRGEWVEVYGAARVFSPLVLLQFLRSVSSRQILARAPLLMVSPRIWIQLLPQIGGVVRGIWAG